MEEGLTLVQQRVCVCVLQDQYSSQVLNARGRGLYCAIDARDAAHRLKLIAALRDKGTLPRMFTSRSAKPQRHRVTTDKRSSTVSDILRTVFQV